MLKQWLRERTISAQADPSLITTSSGGVTTAHDCFTMWQNHFELGDNGVQWRGEQQRQRKAISAMHFHWVQSAEILRPAQCQYDVAQGISSSYQFFMHKAGEVLMRSHSCWCRACLKVAMGGPVGGRDDSGLTSQFEVPKCTRASDEMYQWDLKSCRCICGPDSAQPDVNAKCRGEELVEADVLPGQWVLVEAYSDEEDELWLGKTVACFEGGGCMKEVEERCTIDGTRYDAGNYRIGVQWYERVVEDGGSRLTFRQGEKETSFFCSTELRFVNARVEQVGVAPLNSGVSLGVQNSGAASSSCSSTTTRQNQSDVEEGALWCLNVADKAAGLFYCR